MASIQHLQKCHASTLSKPRAMPVPQGFHHFEKGGFLNSFGEDTGYLYAAVRDRLSIFKSCGTVESANLIHEFSFGPSAVVVDCVYFALNENSPGVVVLVNDASLEEREFYVAYISLTKKKILKKITLSVPAHSIFAVSDGVRYRSQVGRLHQIFQDHWPHILAVSCYGVGAILIHFGISSEDIPEDNTFHKPPHTITLGKMFLNKNSNQYVFRAEMNRIAQGDTKDLYVTSFAYVEKSGIIVMGFPFGGIFTVSLRNQRQRCYLLTEAVVEGINVQFADDDPRGLFYLFFVFAKMNRCYVVSAQCMFHEEDERSGNFDNPTLFFGLTFHLKDCVQFMNVKTMAIDRTRLAAASRETMDCSQDDSAIIGQKSSSLSLYTWYGQPSESHTMRVYGALFDLNMYYTKRIPNSMVPDSSCFRQIPYIAGFISDDSIDLKQIEIMDTQVLPATLRSFVSVESETIDQMFYPSASSYCLKVLTSVDGRTFEVNSIQDEYLMLAGEGLEEAWSNPNDTCAKLNGLGLCYPVEGNDRRFYLLSALLTHGYHNDICRFIRRVETPFEDLKFIIKWLNKEVDVTKEKLDKNTEPLLVGDEISQSSLQFISYSEPFFLRVSQLHEALLERMQTLEKDDQVQLLKLSCCVSKGMHQYALGIRFGIMYRFLPQNVMVSGINKKLKIQFQQRCERAKLNNEKLIILKFIQECMQAPNTSSIWQDQSPEEWYPPQQYSTWLGILLNVDLSTSAKVTLFGYYLHDLDKCGYWSIKKLFETSLGYFLLLEDDKLLSVRRKVERMYHNDMKACREVENTQEAVVVNESPIESQSEIVKLDELPLMNRNDVEYAKGKFLALPNGLHLWNLAVIEKRRFDLIEPVNDIPKPGEHEDIKRSRTEVARIKQKYPWYFRENQFLEMARKLNDDVKDSTVSSPKNIDIIPVERARKRTIAEVDDSIEDNFVLITPVKRDRKSMFVDTPAAKAFKSIESNSPNENDITISPVVNTEIVNTSVSQRHWDRVRQITRTPPATPSIVRNLLSPEPSTPRPQPTSILKSNKRESRLKSTVKKGRLQFDDTLSEVRSIPNRFEQRAQQPDHFTMDDSVTSESDILTGEPIDCYEEEPQELDTSISPMILNLDDDSEEIPVSAENFLKEDVLAESVENNDEEGPDSKKQRIEDDGDVEMEDSEQQQCNVLEKSIEYQSEEDVGPMIMERSIEYQSEEDVVSDSEEVVSKDNNPEESEEVEVVKKAESPKSSKEVIVKVTVESKTFEELSRSEKATNQESVEDEGSSKSVSAGEVVSEENTVIKTTERDVTQSLESVTSHEPVTAKSSDENVAGQDTALSTTTRNWLAAVKRPIRASRKGTVAEDGSTKGSHRVTRASSTSSNQESDDHSATAASPRRSTRVRKSPAKSLRQISEASSSQEPENSIIKEVVPEEPPADVPKSPSKGRRPTRQSRAKSEDSDAVPDVVTSGNKSPAKGSRRNTRASSVLSSQESDVPSSVPASPKRQPRGQKSPSKTAQRGAKSRNQEVDVPSPIKELREDESPVKIPKSPSKGSRRNTRESSILSSQESENQSDLTASPRRSARLQKHVTPKLN